MSLFKHSNHEVRSSAPPLLVMGPFLFMLSSFVLNETDTCPTPGAKTDTYENHMH
jgi:hypothetical protein